jgi:hypothetical protein
VTLGLLKEVQMKTIIAALASASLLAAPMALGPTPAVAQHSHGGFGGGHGGFGGHGGWHGGGFHGGGFHGGGFRGGFHDHGFRGDGFFGGAFLGLALGAAIADSWYYDYPDYYGYYGPYPVDYDGVAPYGDGPDGPPPPQSQSSPQGQAQPGQACGSWSWNAAQSKYNWIGC